MQLTPRRFLMQFAHVAQKELFPHLETDIACYSVCPINISQGPPNGFLSNLSNDRYVRIER